MNQPLTKRTLIEALFDEGYLQPLIEYYEPITWKGRLWRPAEVGYYCAGPSSCLWFVPGTEQC